MAESVHTKILRSVPVNKGASLVTNQHGCDEKLRLNGIITERALLRKNIKAWTTEMLTCSIKRRKELRPILAQANRRFMELNIVIKNNPDMKAAARYERTNDAFVAIARDTLPSDAFNTLMRRAEELMKL